MSDLQPPLSRPPPSAMNPDVIDRIIFGRQQRSRSLSRSRGRQTRRSPLGDGVVDSTASGGQAEMNRASEVSEAQFDNTATEPESTTPRTSVQRAPLRSQSVPTLRLGPLAEVALPQPSTCILRRIATYIGTLFDSQPAIIEYSNTEIAARTSIRIKAEWIQCSSLDEAKKMLRIMAIVRNGDGPKQVTGIVARHKRVKEIMRNSGVGYLAEDVYKKEIFKCMRKLKYAKESVENSTISQ
ncbi:hypothetical protein NX059_001693 [Plenodomus lindquistii]|nr:hypothetical protein NX059_001693 [Plenodomus lindquistii]